MNMSSNVYKFIEEISMSSECSGRIQEKAQDMLKTQKKYVLCPGWIDSENDGDEHYISASELAKLYDVDISDCIILTEINYMFLKRDENLTFLYPSRNGDYTL